MASTTTAISVKKYLRTSYRPDRDYVDGEVVRRNLGEKPHSRMQGQVYFRLMTGYPELSEMILPEQRVQVSATRFRIPDLCVLRTDAPDEDIIRTAPALCIEILSPKDQLQRIFERLQDYFDMGVPVCWVIDPKKRLAWIATPGQWNEVRDGVMRAGEIQIELNGIWK